uniref:Uncharacterized protein n=1 Tax=Leptobrachium leishanense TaxID=445787 RepID=A0A8C5QBS8_9ANUR
RRAQKFLDLREKRCEIIAGTKRPERRRRKRRRWRGKCKKTVEGNQEAISSPPPAQSAALEALQPYFGADDQFEPPVCKKIIKKSRLEEELDGAVWRGDVETAESLSDRLATREPSDWIQTPSIHSWSSTFFVFLTWLHVLLNHVVLLRSCWISCFIVSGSISCFHSLKEDAFLGSLPFL